MIRRTDSQGDVIHFFKIKDLQYFQGLLSNYDLSIVREFLQKNIEIVQLVPFESYHAEPGYRYIPSQNGTVFKGESQQPWQLKQGVPIENNTEEIVSKEVYTLYRISVNTEITLKQLYHLQIPIFAGLKCSEKLLLYGKCDILKVDFGTYIYRKGDPINAIYYLLQGQVKISKKRKEEFIEVATIQKGKMFGVYCLKRAKQNRDLMARSFQNGTRILIIYRQILDSLCKEKDISIEKLIQGIKSQVYKLPKTRSIKRRRQDIQNEIKQNQNTLERRIKGFQQQRCIKNGLLQTLAQTKTLFVRVKNLNSSARYRSKEDNMGLLTNASDVLAYRKEDSSKQKLKKLAETVLTPRQKIEQPGWVLRSFVGLTRYPSVKRYLTRLSKQEQTLE